MTNNREIILPGDKGFKDNIKYPWHKLRKVYGLKEKIDSDNKIEIHGFFVKDNRIYPSIAIFKNCKFPLSPGTRPNIDETPIPFVSLGEAMSYIKSLNLSMDEEKKFSIAALSPDPGVFHPRPDVLFPTKDEFKK